MNTNHCFCDRSNTRPGSTVGGSSPGGSGPPRGYGGGGFYGGGSAVPFVAGAAAGGLAGYAIAHSSLGFWPGHWYGNAYLYDYKDSVTFHNATTNKDETLPVTCGCSESAECSCGNNVQTAKELLGNGTYSALNKSLIDVGTYKNRKTILINGTLPDGTTAPGGSDDSSTGSATSLVSAAGVWPVVACVLATVFLS